MSTRLMPRLPVPALAVDTLSGRRWTLTADAAEHFNLIVFYRGYHCPICKLYLKQLDGLVDEFAKRGTTVFALSSDSAERAAMARDEWELANLDLGYGLPLELARSWGLYVSSSRGKTSTGVDEPALFSEPGFFLVRPDLTLYWSAIQTMPFARPNFREVLAALDFAIAKDYPARGEA